MTDDDTPKGLTPAARFVWGVIGSCIGAAVAFAGLGVLLLLIWNLGFVALLAACGAVVGKISFTTAVFSGIGLAFLPYFLRPSKPEPPVVNIVNYKPREDEDE